MSIYSGFSTMSHSENSGSSPRNGFDIMLEYYFNTLVFDNNMTYTEKKYHIINHIFKHNIHNFADFLSSVMNFVNIQKEDVYYALIDHLVDFFYGYARGSECMIYDLENHNGENNIITTGQAQNVYENIIDELENIQPNRDLANNVHIDYLGINFAEIDQERVMLQERQTSNNNQDSERNNSHAPERNNSPIQERNNTHSDQQLRREIINNAIDAIRLVTRNVNQDENNDVVDGWGGEN